jgi:hypothetical protein
MLKIVLVRSILAPALSFAREQTGGMSGRPMARWSAFCLRGDMDKPGRRILVGIMEAD